MSFILDGAKMEIIRNENTCLVKSTRTSTLIEADILDFEYKKRLTVVINKSVKIPMVWNGKIYEGRSAGLDFLSDGPLVTKTQSGIRG